MAPKGPGHLCRKNYFSCSHGFHLSRAKIMRLYLKRKKKKNYFSQVKPEMQLLWRWHRIKNSAEENLYTGTDSEHRLQENLYTRTDSEHRLHLNMGPLSSSYSDYSQRTDCGCYNSRKCKIKNHKTWEVRERRGGDLFRSWYSSINPNFHSWFELNTSDFTSDSSVESCNSSSKGSNTSGFHGH